LRILEIERDRIQLQLTKSDRVNASARKVANVERNFLDVIKKIENKRKEKKLALDKTMKERMEQDNEEKKKLRTKIKILKEAYHKLTELYQSSQALEKELESKIKECDALKLKLRQLSTSPTPVTYSPRTSATTTTEAAASQLGAGVPIKPAGPIIVGPANQQNFSRVKSMSKWGNTPSITTTPAEPPVQEAPPIIIQPSSPLQAPSVQPVKWNSVKTNRAKDI